MNNNNLQKADNKHLINFFELWEKSWQIYHNKLWILLGIEFVYLLLAIIFSQLYVYLTSIKALGLTIYWIFVLEFCVWFVVGNFIKTCLIFAIAAHDSRKSFKELCQLSKEKFLSVTWVTFLQLTAIIGGLLIFFVPAIILAVGFSIVSFVVIFENLKGSDALIKSWNYVKLHWFQVFLLFLAICLIYLLVSVFIFLILTLAVPKTILFSDLFLNVYILISFLLFSPYLIIYSYYLYQDIKEKKSEEAVSSDKQLEKRQRIIFNCLSVIGLGLIIAALIAPFLQLKRF